MINSVLGDRVTDGGAHEVNFVGNVYKQGPASYLTYDLRAQVRPTPPYFLTFSENLALSQLTYFVIV
jgi:hypothetical protein